MCFQFYKLRSFEEKIALYNSVRHNAMSGWLSRRSASSQETSLHIDPMTRENHLYCISIWNSHVTANKCCVRYEDRTVNPDYKDNYCTFENRTHTRTHTKYSAWKDAQFLRVAESGTYSYHYYLKLELKWTIIRWYQCCSRSWVAATEQPGLITALCWCAVFTGAI
jgi:hypothetical protein